MSRATPENVKSLFRDFCDSADEPAVTEAEIQEFLDDAECIINASFSSLYAMPITEIDNPESFKILRRIEIFKVACIVDDILNTYSESDKKPMWCKKAKEILESFVPMKKNGCKQCEPLMKLPDAEYLGTNIQRGRLKVSATKGTIFRKNRDNW